MTDELVCFRIPNILIPNILIPNIPNIPYPRWAIDMIRARASLRQGPWGLGRVYCLIILIYLLTARCPVPTDVFVFFAVSLGHGPSSITVSRKRPKTAKMISSRVKENDASTVFVVYIQVLGAKHWLLCVVSTSTPYSVLGTVLLLLRAC